MIEIVSDSSVTKDTRRLPAASHKAGDGEFWLVDALGPETSFTFHRWEPAGYTPDHTAAAGFRV